MLIPELGPAPGLIAAIELLHLLQGLQIGIAAQVISVAIGDCQLECRLIEAEKLLEIERRRERNLIGVTHKLSIAALSVGGRLGNIADANVDSLVQPLAANAVPI